jgi:hypothetical protein
MTYAKQFINPASRGRRAELRPNILENSMEIEITRKKHQVAADHFSPFLNQQRMLALVEYWASTQKPNQTKE